MVNDLMGGVVDASFGDPTLVRMAKADKMRVLGSSSDGVWKLNPEIPLISDTIPGFVSENWYGIAAPPKTPKDVLDLLHAQVVIAMKDPKAAQAFEAQGLEPATMEMAAFREYVARDSEQWNSVIKQASIQI